MHGMYGSVEAEFEVQRTMRRAEPTAFLYLLNRVIGLVTVYVEKELLMDYGE